MRRSESSRWTKHFEKFAPGLLGAIFLCLAGCGEKDQSGDWSGHAPAKDEDTVAAAAPVPAEAPVESTPADDPRGDDPSVRFVSYNVRNWLTMDRYVDGKSEKGAPKPEQERLAIARVLADAEPDIIGISEIGDEEDVKDLQQLLGNAGHPMAHFHLHRGADPTRRQVLLSRFPIGDTVDHGALTYRSQGREYSMQRGILDATVDTPAGKFRFLGVHLKSKREIDDGDQADMRLNEAHLLRRAVDGILDEDPQARLVVFGDFNDTRNSPTVRTIRGSGKNPRSLWMIALKDSRGEYWTHHWEYQDLYSRIDYVLISNALRQSVDWDECKVLDGEGVSLASDHRPLLVILK